MSTLLWYEYIYSCSYWKVLLGRDSGLSSLVLLFVQLATLVSPRLAWLMRGDWRGAFCPFILSLCHLTPVLSYEEPDFIGTVRRHTHSTVYTTISFFFIILPTMDIVYMPTVLFIYYYYFLPLVHTPIACIVYFTSHNKLLKNWTKLKLSSGPPNLMQYIILIKFFN